jgi:putative Holliday junction resolvase
MAAMNAFAAKKAAEPAEQPAVHAEPARRILAVDYGRRKIGLALSDELGLTAQPLAVFARKNRQDDLKRLREICHRNSVGHIIVGYPLHITGEASEMAAEAAQFAARLAKALGIEAELVDERLTSWEARQTVTETRTRGRDKRSAVDDVAAAILLREYLERRQKRLPAANPEQD